MPKQKMKLNTGDSQHLNELMRHIIICGACFINHIYIDIFLTVTKTDSIVINIITWGLFLLTIILNSGKSCSSRLFIIALSLNTKLSMLTLALFALKFSFDSWGMKEELFMGYAKMRSLNMQWMGLFKTLPVGVIMAKENGGGTSQDIK